MLIPGKAGIASILASGGGKPLRGPRFSRGNAKHSRWRSAPGDAPEPSPCDAMSVMLTRVGSHHSHDRVVPTGGHAQAVHQPETQHFMAPSGAARPLPDQALSTARAL